jgi:hypothetical protein
MCPARRRLSAFAKATARQSLLSTTLRAKTGGKGIRTPDFQLAKLALYQLSYAPQENRRLKMVNGRSEIAIPGSARNASPARTSRVAEPVSGSRTFSKIVSVRRRKSEPDWHNVRRVRYPEKSVWIAKSGVLWLKRKCRIALHSRSGI